MLTLAVAAAGGAGAWLRFRVAGPGASPWAVLAVNLAGSFALGVVVGLAESRAWSPDAVSVLGTGFLGGFTTFSAFAGALLEDGRSRPARAAVVAVTTLAGAAALAALGRAVAA